MALYVLVGILVCSNVFVGVLIYLDRQTQVKNLNLKYQQYASTHTVSDSEYNDLKAIINMGKSMSITNRTVSEPAGGLYTVVFPVQYAGFILVDIQSSTTNNTFVQVVHNGYVEYDVAITLGSGGKATFPVLPGNIYVKIGNTNPADDATQTLSITYYY